ncbi:MAG: 6-phosphogluconolactonase [Gammaproteobacteria bacterium HGW-Gammaproteobacteria-3]|nr:MAG: 6-phosphogluconolactonase [Gammaproteobacteria bacterium HGW-Gammaproteobacteria-3]
MQKTNWHTFAEPDDVAAAACAFILGQARRAIADRNAFKLVLAGGTTPEKIYHLLAQSQADWEHWHIYFGDERCLPVTNKERNSYMACRTLLDKVTIPANQIHIMPTELGAEAAAEAYRKTVANADVFDCVLLGMGEDGHTASLFPGRQHAQDETVHTVYNSSKPPPERISLSAKTLGSARRVLILVTGAGKYPAVQQWRQGVDLPVARIECEQGVDVYIDTAAFNGPND